jgi:glycine/D-amino acid oxidase-like deaminating enzyme
MSLPGLVICLALLRFATAAVLGGVPLIGPVPELGGLLLATGHEGSGLCMVCFLSHPCARILCASIPYIFHK